MGVRWNECGGDSEAAVGPLLLLVWEGLASWRWVVRVGDGNTGGTACAEAEARTLAENAARAMLDRWRSELGEVDG